MATRHAVARLDAHFVKNVVELEYLLADLAVGEGGAVEVTVALHIPVIADRVGDRQLLLAVEPVAE